MQGFFAPLNSNIPGHAVMIFSLFLILSEVAVDFFLSTETDCSRAGGNDDCQRNSLLTASEGMWLLKGNFLRANWSTLILPQKILLYGGRGGMKKHADELFIKQMITVWDPTIKEQHQNPGQAVLLLAQR